MLELHENEQYFFDPPTLTRLADFAGGFSVACCLCAPTLGAELERRGIDARTLEIDRRFSKLSGFRRYDIGNPEWLGEHYGFLVVDPPFFNAVPTKKLFAAVRMLARNDFKQPLLISWLRRRSSNLLRTFSQFNLEPTGYRPGYASLANEGKNEIEFYGNLGAELHTQLTYGGGNRGRI